MARVIGFNANVSGRSPLAEFAFLCLVIGALAVTGYLSLGAAIDWAATRVPHSVEEEWGLVTAVVAARESTDAFPKLQTSVQELVDRLAAQFDGHAIPHHVYLFDSQEVNAGVLPGGNMLVYTGLLHEVESQNELAMVLGHELAHTYLRHHVKSGGRQLVLGVVTSIVFQNQGLLSSLFAQPLKLLERGYSRSQESEADRLGLELVAGEYGHVGGAFDFFARNAAGDQSDAAGVFFRTHPLSEDRLTALAALAAERGYASRQVTPLALDWSEVGP